ncbi:hypothetical protein BRC81_05765 [Halobacteriales archaeon QS_1_68_20]|nr:MAG: hypothetical protein BRC81_05765 [Halobacteriales archaeon QS_1_68_20]
MDLRHLPHQNVCVDDGLNPGAISPDSSNCGFDRSQAHSVPEDGDFTLPDRSDDDPERSGDVVYEGDATAVHADHDDTDDRAGVEFTVTNDADQDLTITHLTVTPHDGSIDELHDEDDGVGRWVSEVHVDADLQNGVCDVPGSTFLPRTFDMTNDWFDDSADQVAVLSAGSPGSVALGRFEAGGAPVDVVGEWVDVELDYELADGTTDTASFTLDPA